MLSSCKKRLQRPSLDVCFHPQGLGPIAATYGCVCGMSCSLASWEDHLALESTSGYLYPCRQGQLRTCCVSIRRGIDRHEGFHELLQSILGRLHGPLDKSLVLSLKIREQAARASEADRHVRRTHLEAAERMKVMANSILQHLRVDDKEKEDELHARRSGIPKLENDRPIEVNIEACRGECRYVAIILPSEAQLSQVAWHGPQARQVMPKWRPCRVIAPNPSPKVAGSVTRFCLLQDSSSNDSQSRVPKTCPVPLSQQTAPAHRYS